MELEGRQRRAAKQLWTSVPECISLSRRLIQHRRRAAFGDSKTMPRRRIIGSPKIASPVRNASEDTLRKSLVLVPAVLLSCALVSLVPANCIAQDEAVELSAASLALEANALALPGLPEVPSVPAMPSPAPPSPAPLGPEGPRRIGVGAKISLLGIGGEAAVYVTKRINVRGGFNFFNYSYTFGKDGINYGAQLAFRSAEAHLDLFPFAGSFHVSPGLLFYNDNHVGATVTVGGGQAFTLGGASYTSS